MWCRFFPPKVLWAMLWSDLEMINSSFFPLPFIFYLHCHWNSSFSFKKYCIWLVSIHLTPPLCLPFCFSSPCIPASILFLPSPFPSGPVTILVFPKSSAIRHLQWINYTVLSQLDWASNIYSPPPQTQLLPAHLHPLMGLQSFFLSLLSSCFHAPILPSSFSSFPEFQLYPPVLSLPLDKQWRSSPLNTGISVKEEEKRDRFG